MRARAVIAATTVAVSAVGGTVACAATSNDPGNGTTSAASPSRSADGHGLGSASVAVPCTGRRPSRTLLPATGSSASGSAAPSRVLGDGRSDSGADALKKGDTADSLSDDSIRTAAHLFTGTWEDGGPVGFPGHGPGDRHHGDPAEEGKASS